LENLKNLIPFGSQSLAFCPLVWGHLRLTPDGGKSYDTAINNTMRGNLVLAKMNLSGISGEVK